MIVIVSIRSSGKLSSGSCVFGIRDLPTLLKQPALVAHKFYFDFQPAGYFCILKEVRKRSKFPVPFDTKPYTTLPQNELIAGISPQNLTHPNWL